MTKGREERGGGRGERREREGERERERERVEILWITIKRTFVDDLKSIKALLMHLLTWRGLDVILLDAADLALGEGGQVLLKILGFAPTESIAQ